MKSDIVIEYVNKVYAYAVKRTFSVEEADDLSQEILLTVISELPKLRDESRFEPFLWSVANNVTKSYKRNKGRERMIYTYGMPEDIVCDSEDDGSAEELYAALREKIAMMSAIYRDIVILHYFDGLSTQQIAERLGIPVGTVTWRLSEARRKLKKEYTEKDMEKESLYPRRMHISITGSGNYDGKLRPFPNVFINDALSQNILYQCYENARSVEELSKICGVPAYYIEDKIGTLVSRQAMSESVKGKYRTDFVVYSDKYGIYCEENAENAILPVAARMIEALQKIAAATDKIGFYRAEKNSDELFYLFGVMAFYFMQQKYSKLPHPQIEPKYDGWRWAYMGSIETGAHERIGVNCRSCSNDGSGSYAYYGFTKFGGFGFRDIMYNTDINVFEDIMTKGTTEDKNSALHAIEQGYIERRNDALFLTVPMFTREQKAEFDAIVERYIEPLIDDYAEAVKKFASGYKTLFPHHLSDDADRACADMMLGLYPAFTRIAEREGIVTRVESDRFCEVLVQKK